MISNDALITFDTFGLCIKAFFFIHLVPSI